MCVFILLLNFHHTMSGSIDWHLHLDMFRSYTHSKTNEKTFILCQNPIDYCCRLITGITTKKFQVVNTNISIMDFFGTWTYVGVGWRNMTAADLPALQIVFLLIFTEKYLFFVLSRRRISKTLHYRRGWFCGLLLI